MTTCDQPNFDRSAFRLRPCASRRGFSFTEVMFAVILLGIGFIMLAAIFPVAIQQTQQSSDEMAAISVTRTALPVLQSRLTGTMTWQRNAAANGNQVMGMYEGVLPRASEYPANNIYSPLTGAPGARYIDQPGTMQPIRYIPQTNYQYPWLFDAQVRNLWNLLSGSFIDTHDARFAWAPFIMRTPGSPQAKVVLLVLQSRTRPAYNASVDLYHDENAYAPGLGSPEVFPATIEPRPVRIYLTEGSGNPNSSFGVHNPDIIEFLAPLNRDPDTDFRPAVAEGSFVVVSQANDQWTTNDPANANYWRYADNLRLNGRVYRVGARRTDLDRSSLGTQAWELAPGYDMTSSKGPDGETGKENVNKYGIDGHSKDLYGRWRDDYSENLPSRQPTNNKREWGELPSSGADSGIAYIVGRSLRDPLQPYDPNANPFEGPAQDVSVYQAMIPVQ